MAHWYQLTRAANLALGQSLRARRRAAGLSQRDLGQRCCVRYEFIGKMERGIGNPSLGTMAIVAEALGCKVADLLSLVTSDAVTIRTDDMRRAQEATGRDWLGTEDSPETTRITRSCTSSRDLSN